MHKTKPLLLVIAVIGLSSDGFACTPDEAREFVQAELIARVDPQDGCKISQVGALTETWFFHAKYYPVTVACKSETHVTKVVINPETGDCDVPR